MSQLHQYLAALPRHRWEAVQERIEQFESVWEAGQRPKLEMFLPPEPADRGALLAELAHIDLEYRLKAGEPGRVEDYLERFPELAADAHTVLELIVAEYRLRARQDPHVRPADYLSRFPHFEQELTEQLGPPSMLRAYPGADRNQQEKADCAVKVVPGPGVRLGKYRLLSVAGRGACGVVYRAHDPELDRIVALKVYRLDPLADAGEGDRFLREARSAAQLHHPHIVRIFETGRAEDIVYLASEFVSGGTLAEQVRKRRLSPREAAQLLVRVAEAVEHAHRLGVIHRDLKPSNILLDEAGQPHVTDFGLAKRETGDKTLTATGEVLGTPAYMAPEQARGESHQVDARGDVYSLGVILYELLTGEVPFRGTTGAVLRQVLEDDPRPPRRIDEAIPRDLETISLKCLEKEPGRRYATAAALAEELGRWLDGRSIQARPPGRLELVGRWCQRNPRVALLSVTLLLVLAGGFTGVFWQWRRAEAMLGVAQEEHAHAAENFHLALDAVDQYHAQVTQSKQLNDPALLPLRKKLLGTARDFYTRFVQERRDDPKLQAELGRALFKVALITEQFGMEKEALSVMTQALEVRQHLAAAHPEEVTLQLDVATTLNALANIYTESWQLPQALERHQQTQRLGERLIAAHPESPAGYFLRAKEGNNLGLIYQLLEREDEAEQAFVQGLTAVRKLREDHPDAPEYPTRFVILAANLFSLYVQQGRLDAAEAIRREATPIAQKLAQAFPKVEDFQVLRALSRCWASLLQGLTVQSTVTTDLPAQLEGIAARHREYLAMMRAVAQANSSLVEQQRLLVCFLWFAAQADHARGANRAAEATYREALAIATRLADTDSPSATLQITPLPIEIHLAALLRDTGRSEEALALLNQARQRWEHLPQPVPRHPYYGSLLRPLSVHLALTLCELGRPEEALAEWERVLPDQHGRFQHLWQCCRLLTQARRAGKLPAHIDPELLTHATAEAESYLRSDALSAGMAYWLAEVQAMAAKAAAEDPRLATDQRQQRVEACTARALDLLAKANLAGYFCLPDHVQRLREDPYLAILHPRAGFQKLVAQGTNVSSGHE